MQNVLRTVSGTATGSMKTAVVQDAPESPKMSLDQPEPEQKPEQSSVATIEKVDSFRSPALVSDAVRRLGLAAVDRTVPAIDPKRPEVASNMLRAMTNLLTGPQQHQPSHQYRMRHGSHSYSGGRQQAEDGKNYDITAMRRSMIFITSTRNFTGPDRKVAADYIFSLSAEDGGLAEVCEKNAETARYHGRYDHERIFRTLKTLFHSSDTHDGGQDNTSAKTKFISKSMAAKIIRQL